MFRRLAAILVASALIAAIAACTPGKADGKVTVVTSTDVWAAVARAVAGNHADVTALFVSPDGDPHDFSPSAKDTAAIRDASVVVRNGGGYDQYMTSATEGIDSATVIDAFALSGLPSGANEHVFYDLTVAAKVATAVADKLAEKDPDNQSAYRANATTFTDKLAGITSRLAELKKTKPNTRVAQSEPLAQHLLREAGITDATPPGFSEAAENGRDPSALDVARTEDLIARKEVSALLYNTQAVNNATKKLLGQAEAAQLPVVQLTETLPSGVTDYAQWQRANADAIIAAINRA